MVPEDRKQQGLILEMGIRTNIGLPGLARHKQAGVFLNRTQERIDSDRMIEEMKIKTPSDMQQVQYLSGGNQQKVVIGKWLAMNPQVLLLDEPTRGVDIGAKLEIGNLVTALASEGTATLLITSEIEEMVQLSDRVLVLRDGIIAHVVEGANIDEATLMAMALGEERVDA